MKLLFDQNLSHRLPVRLEDLYPGSIHVRDVELESENDPVVWSYAAERGYAITSKDSDFHQRSFLYGPPPKVIWVRMGNCTTRDIEELLQQRRDQVLAFGEDPDASFLALS